MIALVRLTSCVTRGGREARTPFDGAAQATQRPKTRRPHSRVHAVLAAFSLSNTRLSTIGQRCIFVQLSIIFGGYARLETLYTHMTSARFAQGLAALYR